MRFKSLALTALVVLFSNILAGCVGTNQFLQVSSPLAQNLGVRPAPYTVAITNTTQMKADLVAFGEKFGEIFPNETVLAESFYEPLTTNQVPLAVIFLDNSGSYAGVSARILEMGSYAQSFSWIIREGDVIRFGERLVKPISSSPVYEPGSRKIKIPHESFNNGVVWKQIVNDTRSIFRVLVNGRQAAVIKTSGVNALRAEMIYPGYNQPIMITVFGFTEDGSQTGTWEAQLWPQNTGVSAQQDILSPGMFRYQ